MYGITCVYLLRTKYNLLSFMSRMTPFFFTCFSASQPSTRHLLLFSASALFYFACIFSSPVFFSSSFCVLRKEQFIGCLSFLVSSYFLFYLIISLALCLPACRSCLVVAYFVLACLMWIYRRRMDSDKGLLVPSTMPYTGELPLWRFLRSGPGEKSQISISPFTFVRWN